MQPEQAARRGIVRRLALTHFRNYAAVALEADARPVVLSGPNGAGKTNLLEALSLLSPGRGLRRARFAEIARRAPVPPGAPATQPWAVAARIASPDGESRIGTGLDAPPGDGCNGSDARNGGVKRQVRIDGAAARPADLPPLLGVQWLTPAMDRLFIEAAGPRRRFFDRLVFGLETAHGRALSVYERALRERAMLLRQNRRADPDWLGALERRMAEHGAAVIRARRRIAERLNAAIATADETGFPRARMTIVGTADNWPERDDADALAGRLAETWRANRRLDAETGGATVGPHRGDLTVLDLASGQAAAVCSTGEQKALLLSIVLAALRLERAAGGGASILLLDEIAAHLDRDRRALLFEALLALEVQAWLTGTERDLFAALDGRARFHRVEQATILPED